MHNSYFVAFMIFQPFLYHYNALNDIASLYFAKKKKKYNIAPGSSKSFTAISNVALRFVVKLLLL